MKWWQALNRGPPEAIQRAKDGCFAWRPWPVGSTDRALLVPVGDVLTLYADAVGEKGSGATLGEHVIRGP